MIPDYTKLSSAITAVQAALNDLQQLRSIEISTFPVEQWRVSGDHPDPSRPYSPDSYSCTRLSTGDISLTINPPGAFTLGNRYFYIGVQIPPTTKTITWAGEFMFPTAVDAAASQCLEFVAENSITGTSTDCELQLNWQLGRARSFDLKAGSWVDTGINIGPPVATRFIPITSTYTLTSTGAVHTGFTLDGLAHDLSMYHGAGVGRWPKDVTRLNFAIQLDANAAGKAYRVYFRNLRLIYSV